MLHIELQLALSTTHFVDFHYGRGHALALAIDEYPVACQQQVGDGLRILLQPFHLGPGGRGYEVIQRDVESIDD